MISVWQICLRQTFIHEYPTDPPENLKRHKKRFFDSPQKVSCVSLLGDTHGSSVLSKMQFFGICALFLEQ